MKKLYSLLFLLLPLFMFSQTTDLLISKYAEGSSNNKFIEIYNGTGADVDLSTYSLSSCSNGCDTTDEWDYPDNVVFPAGTTIANGDVYVVTHGSADAIILAEGDQTFTYLSNGDDVYALTLAGATADSYTIIDILGDMGDDPGSGWAVGDDSNGTQNQTLTRKTSVCSPNPTPLGSFGTDAASSEWEIGDSDSGWDTLGSYTTACVSSTPESLPWSDSFENGLSSWTNTSATPWAVDLGDDHGPNSVTDGTSAIFFNDYDFSSTTTGDIVSPELDLTSATAPQLTFDYWDSSGSDTVEVLVNGAVAYETAASTNGWESITVDLTSYVGANATVGFRGTSVYGYSNPHIDNVVVAEAPTAASADWDVSAANFSDSATVSVTTDNFTVTDDGSGDGHWHYTLDGGDAVMVYDTNDVTLTGLSSGDHTLVAWLVDNAHADLDPAVTETITWTQTNAPGCGESLSYDYGTGSSGGYNFDGNFTGPDAADLLFTSTVVTAGDTMTVTIGGTTESGYDWVYVTDGAGTVLQAPISGTMGDVAVTSTDGTINVYLASDSSVTSGPVTFAFTCAASTYNVTFSVDMSNYPSGLGASDVVYVNGNFNSWCGECNPMADDDDDGIWTLTLPIADGVYEYKFTVNGWNSQEEFGTTAVEGCTVTDGTFTNRTLTVAGADVTLPTVYWNLCAGETPATYESIPWSDDLEGDLSEFTTYQASSGSGMWAITTSRYHSGVQSVYHSDATGDHDSWLLTPTFDLSGATAPELIYWDNENYSTYYVNHEVLVSEDYTNDVAAATWVELADGVSDEDTWVERGPLALPTTGTVTVAFRYVGNYADAWYLDDISVAEAPADPNTLVADPTLAWQGYMNVFDLTAGAQGGFLWGSAWGVDALATTLNTDADYMTITLEPNYNTYADNPGDAYWQDGAGGGAKFMEADTYVESSTDWNDADLTFTGYVHHHSLASDWTASFFIKALDPNNGYADALNGAYQTVLPTDGQFSVTVSASELVAGLIVQAGFSVDGSNANPDNQAANGKVIISGNVDAPMSIDDENILDMRIYPNPVDGSFVTILSPVNGTKYIQVFDINGRRVMDTSINNNMLDVSSINSGFYMIKVTIDGQSKISKLVIR